MPPTSASSPPNPLDVLLQVVGLFFAERPGGRQKAAAFQRRGDRAVRGVHGRLVSLPAARAQARDRAARRQYSQQRTSRSRSREVLWDIWTLYFRRPFVPTHVAGGARSSSSPASRSARAFPHEIRVLHNTAYTVGYCDDLADPAWVGYRVFDLHGHATPPKRPEGFFIDPRTAARVEPGDYSEQRLRPRAHGPELRHRHPLRRGGAGGDVQHVQRLPATPPPQRRAVEGPGNSRSPTTTPAVTGRSG